MVVPENSISASLVGDQLQFSADVENTSGFTSYEATVRVTATAQGQYPTLLWEAEFTPTVSPNQTVELAGTHPTSAAPGTDIEVCANVTSIFPVGGGGL